MKCTTCGEDLVRGQVMCPRCGSVENRQRDTVRCTACGGRMAGHLWVCPRCGHDSLTGPPRLWQRPAVHVTTLATLGTLFLLLVLLTGGPLSAGSINQSSALWFVAARPTDTPTFTPAPTATHTPTPTPSATPSPPPTLSPTPSPTATPVVRKPPTTGEVLINPLPHVSQQLNNCGPASVSMVLAHFGISQSQEQVAQEIKPSAQDINVRLDEVADYLNAQGLSTKYGVEGTPELLTWFVSNNVPVIIETWIEYRGGMGHFRVVRGFDADAQKLIAHDPLGGADLRFGYDVLDLGWQVFNRHYLAVYRPDQEPVVATILGENYDGRTMRQRALSAALARVEDRPGDGYAWLNLGADHAALEQYEEAGQAYEKAMALGMPDRLLWYYHKPLEVYNALGEYRHTIQLTTAIISHTNGLEEIYYLRGVARQGLGEITTARIDYQTALALNPNYAVARAALEALSE
ncbi:MAG: C39 family peptidase [Chloroflexota bacterium]|nr:C39 family peptidase [Chloroflexota bacterium]